MKMQFLILYACLFVVMIGYGITLPLLPFYVERLLSTDSTAFQRAYLQISILTSIFALMQFLFAPVWGRFSDKAGRRTVIMIGLSGYAISMVLFGLGTNLTILYSARILGGILSSALLPVANAYVADFSTKAERGKRIAELNASIGMGLIVGPVFGALLSKGKWHLAYRFSYFYLSDFSMPFLTASVLALIALVSTLLLSSKPIMSSDKESKKGPSIFQNRFIPKSLRKVLLLSALSQLSLSLFEGTFVLHSQKTMNFGPLQLSLVFLVCGSVMTLVQATIVARAMDIFGDNASLRIGFGFLGMGLVLLMTTQTMTLILTYVLLLGLGMAILTPTLSVVMTKNVENHLGTGLGLQSSANSLGQTLGPLIGGFLLAKYVHVPYLIIGVISLGIALFMHQQEIRK